MVLARNLPFFFCGQFHVKLAKNGWIFFCCLAQKMKLAVVSCVKLTKIMKLSDSVRKKKLKLTARGFAAAASFNFFLTESGSFIILVSFTHETTASFIC